MRPHDRAGGGTPRPRKEGLASVRMAVPTPNDSCTSSTSPTFGRRCRHMIARRGAPSARAAVMNSRSRSESTSPRTRIAKVGTKVTASAPITFQRLTPRKAVIARARMSDGNTRSASIARIRRSAGRPGAMPAASPAAVPTPAPTRTESTPTTMEIRAPAMTWLSTSRPSGSVPRTWAAVGRLSVLRTSYRAGSCGVIRAPSAAQTRAPPMTSAPRARGAAGLLVADARVHQAVADLHQEVGQEHADGDDDDHALHHREVPAQDGVHEQDADPGQRED